jgi:diaminopimelate epimerase
VQARVSHAAQDLAQQGLVQAQWLGPVMPLMVTALMEWLDLTRLAMARRAGSHLLAYPWVAQAVAKAVLPRAQGQAPFEQARFALKGEHPAQETGKRPAGPPPCCVEKTLSPLSWLNCAPESLSLSLTLIASSGREQTRGSRNKTLYAGQIGHSMSLANRPYLKMNGAGNEIVVLDLRDSSHIVSAAEARAIAANPPSHFDQLMVLHAPRQKGTQAFMRIYNKDGSASSACGNGTRCVAWAMLKDQPDTNLILETEAGLLDCRREDETHFTVDMGPPRFHWQDIPLSRPIPSPDAVDFSFGPADAPLLSTPSVVNMGNPHVIFFVTNVAQWDVPLIGPQIEHDPLFPERVNVSFAEVTSHTSMNLRVWERGAGETRACGSGACAAAVAAIRRGLTERRVHVHLPGGELIIEWRTSDDHVLMTGPTALEHQSHFDPALFTS